MESLREAETLRFEGLFLSLLLLPDVCEIHSQFG